MSGRGSAAIGQPVYKSSVLVGGAEVPFNPFVALWNSSLTELSQLGNYQGSMSDIETDHGGLTAGQTYYTSVDNHTLFLSRLPGHCRILCLSDVVDYNYW
ncbi:MAG: hypothetical protein IPJ20_14910 [Flammeovirgaceae bacterium]|nr:hypothetical protein [Flammeovirgaceae bacterium]